MPPGGPGGMRGPNRFLTEEEKKNRPRITKALLKRIFSYLLPYWPQLLLVLAAIILSSVFGLLPSILTGKIIDEGLIGKNFSMLLRLIGLSFAVLVISNLIGVLESYLNTWMAQHITYDMRNQMYAHLQKMSHRFFTSSRQGDVITRMASDISGVQSVISNTLTSILSNIAVLATSGSGNVPKKLDSGNGGNYYRPVVRTADKESRKNPLEPCTEIAGKKR